MHSKMGISSTLYMHCTRNHMCPMPPREKASGWMLSCVPHCSRVYASPQGTRCGLWPRERIMM